MSFPRYPAYKDSGVAWLGEVPAHWVVLPVKNVANIVNGYPFDSKQFDPSEGYPLVRIRDLNCSAVDTYINGEFVEQAAITSDDVLIGMDGDFNVGRWRGDGVALLNQRMCCVRGRNVLISRLLEYALPIPLKAINDITYSTTVKHLSSSDVEKTRVALPREEFEQQAIAAFLDRETGKIDALVAEQEKLIALLKEKRQAIISHAVTKGLNPSAKMKDSGIEWLGEVPVHWEVSKLGRSVFMQEGPGLRTWQFMDEGIRVICVTNITEYGIDFSLLEKFIAIDEYDESYQHFTVQNGDVLLSSSGNSWGKVATYKSDERVILNTSTIRLNETEGAPILADYIAPLLQSGVVREQLSLAMTGSCQPNFGPTHLSSVIVAIPPKTEQSFIAASLDRETARLDTLTAEAQHAIELLKERRSALISAAVTGKIDVRHLSTKQETA